MFMPIPTFQPVDIQYRFDMEQDVMFMVLKVPGYPTAAVQPGHEWVPHPDGKLHPIDNRSLSWRFPWPMGWPRAPHSPTENLLLLESVAAARHLPAPDNLDNRLQATRHAEW